MERQPSVEGVYANHRFMQAAVALVGLPVQVEIIVLFFFP